MGFARKEKEPFPVVVDTFPGRDMRVSEVQLRFYDVPDMGERLPMMSSAHRKKMKELPF